MIESTQISHAPIGGEPSPSCPAEDSAVWYRGKEPISEREAKRRIRGGLLSILAGVFHPDIYHLEELPYRRRCDFAANAIIGRLVYFAPARRADPWPPEDDFIRNGVIVGRAAIRVGDQFVGRLVLDPRENPETGKAYVIRNGPSQDDVL
jgi:hypothetical protein